MGVLNIAGPITGNFGFTKSGAGLLALTGANTFVGTTSVTALTASNTSVLNINSNAALGAAGNGLAFTGTGTATLQLAAGAGAVTLAGRATTIGTSVTAIFDTNGAANSLTFDTAIGGTGALVKGGAGTMTLTAANSYAGTTQVTGGGAFAPTGFTTGPSTLVVSGQGTLGGGAVTVSPNAALTLDYRTVAGVDESAVNRLADGAGVTLNGGTLNVIGGVSGTTEAVGTLTFAQGGNNVVLTPAAGQAANLTASAYARNLASVNTFTGPNLGTSPTTGSQVKFGTAPTVTGLGTNDATALIGAYGVDTAIANSAASTLNTGFVTYDASGVRLLNPTTEQYNLSKGAVSDSLLNARLTLAGASGSIPAGTNAISTLQIDNTNASGTSATVTNSASASDAFRATSGYLFTGNSPITLMGNAFVAAGNTGQDLVIMTTNTAGVTVQTPFGKNTIQGPTSNTVVTIGGTGNITFNGVMGNNSTGIIYLSGGSTLNMVGTGTLTLGNTGANGTGEVYNFLSGYTKFNGGGQTGYNPITVAAGATLDLNGQGQISINPFDFGETTFAGSVTKLGATGNGGTITNTSATLVTMPIYSTNVQYDGFSGAITGNISLQIGVTTTNSALGLLGKNTFTGGLSFSNVGLAEAAADTGLGALPTGTGTTALLGTTRDNIAFTNQSTSEGGLVAYQSFTVNSARTIGIGPQGANSTTSGVFTGALGAVVGQTLTFNGVIETTTTLSTGVQTDTMQTPSLVINQPAVAGLTGTVALGGLSTYAGTTTLGNGTLSFNSIGSITSATPVPSALGEPTTAANGTIALGSTTNAVTLRYTGAATTTDRVLNLAGTTGAVTLDASGTGAIAFTSAMTATGAGAKTLTLTGSNTGANSLAGVPSPVSNVTKTGPGTWQLTGTSGYTGATTISGGMLVAAANTALGATTGVTVSSGSLLLSNTAATDRVPTVPISLGLGTTFGRTGTGNITEGTGAHVTAGMVTGTPATSTVGMGALSLTGNAALDFGTGGVGTFVFSGFTPGGFKLVINNDTTSVNYASVPMTSGTDGTDDRLIFNTSEASNLGAFSFTGQNGQVAAQQITLDNGFYEIVPAATLVPEPRTWAVMLPGLALCVWSQRRRLMGRGPGAKN